MKIISKVVIFLTLSLSPAFSQDVSNIDLDIKEESNFNQVSKKLVVFYFIQALVKLYPDLRCGLEINLSLLNTTNYINAKYHQLIRYLINILVSEKYCDRIGEKVILSRMVTVDNLYSRFFSKFGITLKKK